MTQEKFDFLFAEQKEELVDNYGTFIRTETAGDYLCDIYLYDNFYVVFFYLYNQFNNIGCHCFDTAGQVEPFLLSLVNIKNEMSVFK